MARRKPAEDFLTNGERVGWGLAVLVYLGGQQARPHSYFSMVADGTDARRGKRHSGHCWWLAEKAPMCGGIATLCRSLRVAPGQHEGLSDSL